MPSTAGRAPGYTPEMVKTGRPTLGKSETMLVTFKAPKADVRAWRAAAKRAGTTLSEWLRALADKAAR